MTANENLLYRSVQIKLVLKRESHLNLKSNTTSNQVTKQLNQFFLESSLRADSRTKQFSKTEKDNKFKNNRAKLDDDPDFER